MQTWVVLSHIFPRKNNKTDQLEHTFLISIISYLQRATAHLKDISILTIMRCNALDSCYFYLKLFFVSLNLILSTVLGKYNYSFYAKYIKKENYIL